MVKTIPWHGKVSQVENKCPHCGVSNMYSDKSKNVMELSAQHYKVCVTCQGEFVDTYFIDFGDDDESRDNWEKQRYFELKDTDHAELFDSLNNSGWIEYDDYEGREDSDYYDIPPQSIHFIKE
jgi:hypothetical protein